jgi:hypothetical protein
LDHCILYAVVAALPRKCNVATLIVHTPRRNLSCNICCTTTAATKNAVQYWLQGASDQGVRATQRIFEQSAKERMKE